MSTFTQRTSTMPDLRSLVERHGPFLTASIPARSDIAGAADRFETQIDNTLRDAPPVWEADVAEMRHELETLPHHDGAAVIALRPMGGPSFYEFIDDPVHRPELTVASLPRLAPLIEARQRLISHVVVETDLAGADLVAFDSGSVAATDQVEGDTEHIHRGHPGGWSQRRFQQRAEHVGEQCRRGRRRGPLARPRCRRTARARRRADACPVDGRDIARRTPRYAGPPCGGR